MRRFVSSPTHTEDSQRGAALVWVAGSLIALLAMASLAIDLGWYYVNASRLQRAADAAALAGVVHLPGFPSDALDDATAAVTLNGFPGATVTDDTTLADNKYQVTVSTNVKPFIAEIVGVTSLPLSRTSTAEYVKPVPLGSPSNTFGVGTDSSQNFWAAIQGPWTAIEHGDPYATECITANSSGCIGTPNAKYRAGGYYYGIEVKSGTGSLQVQLYDAGFYDRTNFAEAGDEDDLSNSDNGGADMHFQLYGVDSTPLDPSDNPAIGSCSLNITSETSSSTYKNKWVNLCSSSIANPTPGIYVMRVWTTGNKGGSSHYSVRSVTNNNTTYPAAVYGINDMSIFTNDVLGSGTATLYLAKIDPIHAGKRLELKFYDPGEAQTGTGTMTVKMPNGTTPNCSWYSVDNNDTVTHTSGGTVSCSITTTISGNAQFNAQWIIATVQIPSTYTCNPSVSTDCWWKMVLSLPGTPHDRTTWQARVIGNPVRLVENP